MRKFSRDFQDHPQCALVKRRSNLSRSPSGWIKGTIPAMQEVATAKAVVLALMMFLGASLAPADPVAEPAPEEISLWQRAVSAVQAPIAQLRKPSIQSLLESMDDVRVRLALRAASANRRATAGAISAAQLAGKIPVGVRGAGEQAILEFLDNRHLSHIQSVKNSPAAAASSANVVFESAQRNLARGFKNMDGLDLLRANADNAGASLSAGRFAMLAKTGQGCVIGGLLELPVTVVEQKLQVDDEAKTGAEAVRDGFQSVATTTVLGCAVAGGAAVAIAATGVTLGPPILVPIAVSGGVAYVWVSSERIWSAVPEDERRVILNKLAAVQDTVLEARVEEPGSAQAAIGATTDSLLERIQQVEFPTHWW